MFVICQVRAGVVVLLTLSLNVVSSWREQTGGHHESARADGAAGAVEDHSVGRGKLPGQALWVHAGVPKHSGQGFPKDSLHQGGQRPVSVCVKAHFNLFPVFYMCAIFFNTLRFFLHSLSLKNNIYIDIDIYTYCNNIYICKYVFCEIIWIMFAAGWVTSTQSIRVSSSSWRREIIPAIRPGAETAATALSTCFPSNPSSVLWVLHLSVSFIYISFLE